MAGAGTVEWDFQIEQGLVISRTLRFSRAFYFHSDDPALPDFIGCIGQGKW